MEYLKSVVAIVVTYQPDINVLSNQLTLLHKQINCIIIIDNDSNANISDWNQCNITKAYQVVTLEKNFGIGVAQNIGIKLASKLGADFVLLMDQDSIPMPDMVYELVEGYNSLIGIGHNIAAVGCQYLNNNMQLSGFVKFTGGWGSRISGKFAEEKMVECDFLIASGTLISISALNEIGLMDEGLFIDHVDTEWCLRARSKGYKLYGVCSAVMKHQLGNYVKRIWFLRWRNVSVHSQFRYYYMIRNSILLHKRDYPDMNWRIFDIQRLLQLILFFGLFVPGRFQRLKMMVKGGYDGFRGITGKMV